MQYSFIAVGAALAQFAQAVPAVQRVRHYGVAHEKREIQTKIDLTVVTVTEYVTAGAPSSVSSASAAGHWRHYGHSHKSSSAAAATSAAPSYASTSSEPGFTIQTSIPSEVESSTAAPTTLPGEQKSSSVAPVVSSSVSSAAVSSAEATSSSGPTLTYSAVSKAVTYASSAPAYSSAAPSSSGMSSAWGGKKAGLSGYIGIQEKDAFSDFAPYISWYSDYTAVTPTSQGVKGVGMIWGADGSPCGEVVTERLSQFNTMIDDGTTPEIMFGMYEPDCTCSMSSDMSVDAVATAWDSLIAPLAAKGTVLGSPSMCKQKDEDMLTPINDAISTSWNVTSIHINKPDLAGAKEDVEYYVKTYGKPVFVSEFACVVDTPSWAPCTDQTQINTFINDVVSYFESNDDVVAYGASNGEGLGDVWPLTDSSTGKLTESGTTYLNAIKGL